MYAVPATEAARRSEDLLRRTSPPHLVNHCLRSYHWAAAVGYLEGVRYDPEVLFVSAALHDLGLLDDYDRGGPFEVDGARAAAGAAEGYGWPAEQREVVADVVRLHVAPLVVADDDGPEAYLLWHGTGVDVSGSRVRELDPGLVAEVLAELPRLDFRDGFAELFSHQATAKPGSRAAELVSQGLLDRLARCVLDQSSG